MTALQFSGDRLMLSSLRKQSRPNRLIAESSWMRWTRHCDGRWLSSIHGQAVSAMCHGFLRRTTWIDLSTIRCFYGISIGVTRMDRHRMRTDMTGVTRLYLHSNATCHRLDLSPLSPRILQVLRIIRLHRLYHEKIGSSSNLLSVSQVRLLAPWGMFFRLCVPDGIRVTSMISSGFFGVASRRIMRWMGFECVCFQNTS